MWFALLLFAALQDQSVFRADTALVHVEAEVRHGGRAVAALVKEDFRVLDNGKPQPIVYLAHEEQPLDIILLFDTRAEMRPAVEKVASAAETVLGGLRPVDRVAVMSFGGFPRCQAEVAQSLTADVDAAGRSIQDRILTLEFRGGSNGCSIQRGLDAAAQLFLTRPPGARRRAILVVTDDKGSPTRSDLVRATLLDLWNADAVVLGVVIHSSATVIAIGPPYRGLRYAADHTGGDAIETADPAAALRESIQGLRSRYSLYYAPPSSHSGEQRKIRVTLTPPAARRYPGALIRARSGYVVH